ncbi:MAG: uroporphyrinogen-III C-methyltransferase [Sedimentisphaerales bacterium]|nr:uroporphyrinogen-III C-methyltransferase [Sedimentisphaerales bacterium]
MNRPGIVYLVGAGPGDPGLITCRGRDLLPLADCIIYDHLVSPNLLTQLRTDAERVYVGKQAGRHTLAQDEINRLLVEKASGGLTVVRLKGGDPFVFGRGGEEALALTAAGIPFEVVPGVTAAVAAAAYAGIPVTHRGLASEVAFITGHEDPSRDDSHIDWPSLARWQGTLAFYMGVRNLPSICEALQRHGMASDTPAALIAWGTTARQRTLVADLATLAGRAQEEGFTPPAVAVIGRVVSLREQLAWFERRPLFGRRIVVTRARAQASDLAAWLTALGADVLECPTIRIEPPEDPGCLLDAARRVCDFDWLILTSVNGVDAVFGALARLELDARHLAHTRVCAIGPATAERLAAHGIRPDLVPERYLAEGILEAFDRTGSLVDKKFLLARADLARADLADGLAQRGAHVEQVVAYRTAVEALDRTTLEGALTEDAIDWFTFASASTVNNLMGTLDLRRFPDKKFRIASIGPITSATILEHGLKVQAEAVEHTIPGLVQAIVAAENTARL